MTKEQFYTARYACFKWILELNRKYSDAQFHGNREAAIDAAETVNEIRDVFYALGKMAKEIAVAKNTKV